MTSTQGSSLRNGYVDLLKRAVTNYLYLGEERTFENFRCIKHYDVENSAWKIEELSRPATLLTKDQLDLVEHAVVSVEQRGIPGDFMEAGVWRGGVIIFLRGLMHAHDITDRMIIAADSFSGIPKNTRAVNDPVDEWPDRWEAGIDEVKRNIARFGFLDERIRFLVGYFETSLKELTDETFALIRLDSDSYDSVETSLESLYPRVSDGGIVIVDDWHLPGCQMAVRDYVQRTRIKAEIRVHGGNAWWVKQTA